jgi:uncharacterized repeat protein (TIGR01451 family)
MTGARFPGMNKLSGLHGALLCALVLCAPASWAAGTTAGTNIQATATATYVDGEGAAQAVESNTVALTVDELLNLALAGNDAGRVRTPSPAESAVLSYTLTNTGNGTEAFALAVDNAVAGDDFDPLLVRIVLDDGDGLHEAGVDPEYVPGSNDPVLAPDASRVIFVVNDIPSGLANGDIGISRLTATALTGSGTPGTTFSGQGDGGVDAVVGANGASATAEGQYEIAQAAASLSLSQSISDPFGGSSAVPGAVITYTATFAVSGSGEITETQVTHPIPAGTTYQPGSLSLDGSALTDADDADAGRFTGTQTEVELGTLTAPTTRVIQLQVQID